MIELLKGCCFFSFVAIALVCTIIVELVRAVWRKLSN